MRCSGAGAHVPVAPAALTGTLVSSQRMTCTVTCPRCSREFKGSANYKTYIATVPTHKELST